MVLSSIYRSRMVNGLVLSCNLKTCSSRLTDDVFLELQKVATHWLNWFVDFRESINFSFRPSFCIVLSLHVSSGYVVKH